MPRPITTRVFAYHHKGEHDKAIADFPEAVRLDPKHAKAYCNRGGVYYVKGEHDKAIADFTEATRLDPKSAKAYYGRPLSTRRRASGQSRSGFRPGQEARLQGKVGR